MKLLWLCAATPVWALALMDKALEAIKIRADLVRERFM
jgi:hypothetical protein